MTGRRIARALPRVSEKVRRPEDLPIRTNVKVAALIVALSACTACGGGGGGGGAAIAPAPAATPTPQAYTVSGTVVQIPADAYGPAVIAGITYASADAMQTTPLNNATVIVGPVPITGATPPASLPAGDVQTVTNAAGAFSTTLTTAPGPTISAEQFVIPQNNILAITPPNIGYYVEVFGFGTDGITAGSSLPVHKFLNAASPLVIRVSTITPAEAGALRSVNSDRAIVGASPLIFDQAAEEVARLHASDESSVGYTCHYDTKNVGPSSRYLAVGGIGLTGEGLGLVSGPSGPAAFANVEAAYLAEKSLTPPGGHYLNLQDPSHLWAGLASATFASSPNFSNVDYDLITPNAQSGFVGSSGYQTVGVCTTGVVNNFS